jgi:hypothetical protein
LESPSAAGLGNLDLFSLAFDCVRGDGLSNQKDELEDGATLSQASRREKCSNDQLDQQGMGEAQLGPTRPRKMEWSQGQWLWIKKGVGA